jgi:hypothetical protein
MSLQRILLRRGTTAEWNAANPILTLGEPAAELKTNGQVFFKIGDGINTWSNLPYFVEETALEDYYTAQETDTEIVNSKNSILGNVSSSLNTLEKIETELGEKSGVSHTHTKSQITDFAHTHDAAEITNTLSEITASSYTLQASDNGKLLILNSSSATTLTVDDVFSVGHRVDLYKRGEGEVSFVAGTGTLEASATSMPTRYTVASIMCVAVGVYAIVGSLE